jgi:hypothetical protein
MYGMNVHRRLLRIERNRHKHSLCENYDEGKFQKKVTLMEVKRQKTSLKKSMN